MDVNKLIAIVTILITLSIASERLVEIIKGFFPKLITPPSDDPQLEARRKANVSLLAVASGIITTFLASPLLAGIFKDLFKDSSCPMFISWFGSLGNNAPCGFSLNTNGLLLILALGLLASGGSSLWNSILEYLLKIKDLKKIEVAKANELKNIEIAKSSELKAIEVAKANELKIIEVETAKANLPPTTNKE